MSQIDPASYPSSSSKPPPSPPVPVPVQPLTYSVPWQQNRPGLITAIGVLCIVVACLSGLTSFLIGLYGSMFWMFANMTSSASTTAGASSTMASAPSADQKLPVGDAGVADNTLRSLLALDSRRLRELDKLMRKHGRAVFPADEDNDGAPLTAAAIRAAVKDHQSAPDARGGGAAAHFTTESGSVDIYPDHAVFTAADGTTTIQTSAAQNWDSESSTNQVNMHVTSVGPGGGAAAASQPATTLTPAQVQQVIKTLKRRAGQSLNAAQLATVQAQLAAPNQQLVTNPGGSPVTSVMPQNPNVMIQFDNGWLTIGPQGQVISMFSFNNAAFTGTPSLGITAAPAALLIIEAIGSIVLAVYLLIVGILVFRSSFKAPRLLRIYAWIKIPLALAAGTAITWMGYEFITAITRAAPAGSAPGITYIAIWGAVLAALGLAFPIGLLFALRSRTARDFFHSVSPS